MQQIDAQAIDDLGIPRLLLMEHAGLALVNTVRSLAPQPAHVFVCCGTGFNGGDGLAAARHLHEWGYPTQILIAGTIAALRPEPAIFATILRRLGLSILECPTAESLNPVEDALARSALLIDALLGIGIRDDVREPIASLIRSMNRSGRPIVCADVPSGLDADTGRVCGIAVRATATVAFGLAKQGCFIGEGPVHAGSLTVASITIPRAVLEEAG